MVTQSVENFRERRRKGREMQQGREEGGKCVNRGKGEKR